MTQFKRPNTIMSFLWLLVGCCQSEQASGFNLDFSTIEYTIRRAFEFFGSEYMKCPAHSFSFPVHSDWDQPEEIFRELQVLRSYHKSIEREKQQAPIQKATENLICKGKLRQEEIEYLSELDLSEYEDIDGLQQCLEEDKDLDCDPDTPYRTYDGTCNNLKHTRWGAAFHCHRRLLLPAYSGADCFRKSVCGGPLPNPRKISVKVHNHVNRPSRNLSQLYMYFGQFIAHEITFTPDSSPGNGYQYDCCGKDSKHPQCSSPLRISRRDYFYRKFNVTCTNFVRSSLCLSCRLGYRTPKTQTTNFLDGSNTYGISKEMADKLRNFDGTGTLKVVQESGCGDLLPNSFDPTHDACSRLDTNEFCFEAGDFRVNQHPCLTCLHTIFVRLHNIIAKALAKLQPTWDGERLFQETRKIIAAILQVITYGEYLPITLGEDVTKDYNLKLKKGRSTLYLPDMNPTTSVEFSSATLRFGHTLSNFNVANGWPNKTSPMHFKDSYLQPFYLRTPGMLDSLVVKSSRAPCQRYDRHMVKDLSNFLFKPKNESYGNDLGAIDINRGRDHGLQDWLTLYQYCFPHKDEIKDFDDLHRSGIMSWYTVQLLRSIYCDVRDIDAWTGILCEIPIKDAVVGPTGICIIGRQFHNLKFGDRFYFEHSNQAGSFTPSQREALKSITLSSIICATTKIEKMPENAMLLPCESNKEKSCKKLEKLLDLSPWRRTEY